jgi:predicted permease
LTENIALWMMAGAAGVAFSAMCLHSILPYVSRVFEEFPQLNPIAVNSRAAVYALLLTLATGTLFGLAPALQASRLDIAGVLKESGRSLVCGRRAHNLRKALVASEAGFSVVLLIGAGLLTKSLVQLATQPLGFQGGDVTTFKVELSGGRYKEPGRRYRFYDRLLETMTKLPGVEYAGATSALPLQGTVVSGYSILGRPAAPNDSTLAGNEAISPGYFEALGIPVVRGRVFNVRDSEGAGPVAVINRTLAQRRFANEDPIGRRIKFGDSSSAAPWMTVVGVVGDVKHAGLDWDYLPLIYVPYRQIPAGYEGLAPEMFFVVRGAGRLALRNEIRTAVSSLDRSAPVVDMMSMKEIIATKELPSELNSAVFGGFAALALLLAAIGLYAIVSQSALERRKEIGIRIALGATPREVIGSAMREGVSLGVAGVVVGLAGGVGLTRLLRSMLYGVAVADISIFLGAAALLLAIAAAASLAPACRAASTDPLEALRCE